MLLPSDVRTGLPGKGIETDAQTLAAQIGLAKAMRKHDLRKVITFHSSVRKAQRFVDPSAADSFAGVVTWMPRSSKPSGKLWAKYISGRTPAGTRKTLIDCFASLPAATRGVMSNCACLGEGVDVPILDGVAFMDPKRSMVDIIQAVGRVIRKAEDKQFGALVIPVLVDEHQDAGEALTTSAFEPVWQVLRALRSHDTKLGAELDELRFSLGKRPLRSGKIRLPAKITVDVPKLVSKNFVQVFYVRTVEKTTGMPPLTFAQILAWADEHKSCTGEWPKQKSGPIQGTQGESWSAVDQALAIGRRGVPGGSSLAQLLKAYRST